MSAPSHRDRDHSATSRIFLGNLASERTNSEELERIFTKYGRILEVVIRKRFLRIVLKPLTDPLVLVLFSLIVPNPHKLQ